MAKRYGVARGSTGMARNWRDAAIRKASVEALEERRLLSAQVADSMGGVSPAWFAEVSTITGRSADAVKPGAADLDARWIVTLNQTAVAGMRGAADAVSLFSNAPFGVEVVRGLGMAGQLLIITQSNDMGSVSDWLRTSPSISSYEPDQMVYVDAMPDDPSLSQLWGMNNTGQTGGTTDSDIDAPEAWDITTGSNKIVVAVIDTGVDYTHPDLAANIWTNPGETPGNGIDDDGNGFVDDVHGYDFVNNDGDPMDDHGHGTHCSGTIGGVGNNATGVVGVNWTTSIMGLKAFDSSGSATSADEIRAVNYATMMKTKYSVNIRLSSNSWGGSVYDQNLYDAIKAGGDAGILFVAAAGNSSDDNDTTPHYPSSFDLPCIIAVAATDNQDSLANFSCYGATSVDLAAPGVGILSTMPNNAYGLMDGTSMATPHVSGVAALVSSIYPNLTVAQLKDAILKGVDPVSSLKGMMVTGGRLNAFGTLEYLGMYVTSSSPAAGSNPAMRPVDFVIDFSSPYAPATAQAGDLTVNGLPANSVNIIDTDTLAFHYIKSPVSVSGPQTMSIAGGMINRASDNAAVFGWTAKFFWYNTAPIDIALSNSTLGDNSPVGTLVGTLSTTDVTDPDVGPAFTYTLVPGTGSADNASFAINGKRLESASLSNFAVKRSYSVRIRSTDSGGMHFDKAFTVSVDDPPVNVALSNFATPENQPAGTVVGTLSSTDPNVGDTFTYSLVSGSGGNDNASFTVSGNQVMTSNVFDYEAQNTYSIRIRTTDAGGMFAENAFNITVIDRNDSPTGIALSNALVTENVPAGTVVGALSSRDQDSRDTFTYMLVPGSGGSDNASFTISGSQLLVTDSVDYESKNVYSVRVRTTDAGGLTFDKAFTVSVKDVNETPTNVALVSNSVAEHRPAGTVVGLLSTADQDARDMAFYSLVDGDGSDDNGSFAIDGDSLTTMVCCNYETKDTYSIRLRTTDSGGLSCDKVLSVNVANVNEWPTDLALSSINIPENQAPGTTVGILEATDPDLNSSFTYSVAPRIDGPDYTNFTVVGDELKTTSSFDFDAKRSYSVRARVVDQGGLYYEKTFVISVTDLPEFGTMADGKVRSVKLADTDGDQVTYALTGGGSGTVQPDHSLTLTGTTAKSVLAISVARKGGGDGKVILSGIFSDGRLKKISGKGVVVKGPIVVVGFGHAGAAAANMPSSPAAGSIFSGSRISAFDGLIATAGNTLLDDNYQGLL